MLPYISLEEKKNETVSVYPTFLAQEISRENNNKMIRNAIAQIQDKTANATHQGESKNNRRSKMKIEK